MRVLRPSTPMTGPALYLSIIFVTRQQPSWRRTEYAFRVCLPTKTVVDSRCCAGNKKENRIETYETLFNDGRDEDTLYPVQLENKFNSNDDSDRFNVACFHTFLLCSAVDPSINIITLLVAGISPQKVGRFRIVRSSRTEVIKNERPDIGKK